MKFPKYMILFEQKHSSDFEKFRNTFSSYECLNGVSLNKYRAGTGTRNKSNEKFYFYTFFFKLHRVSISIWKAY